MLNSLIALIASGTMLVSHDQLSVFQAKLQSMLKDPKAGEVAAMLETASADDDEFWPEPEDGDSFLARLRPYKVVDGVLHIPVMGVLLHRFPYAWGSYATGYEYIRRAIVRGLADGNVKGIAFVEDSPGGMVAGCFELCDDIAQADREKPVRAYASDHAYSAAYAIASQARQISVTRSGGVGSVGVVTSHVDFSEYLSNEGIKITFIHAGKHKVEGNPYEPLSAEARTRIQARIDKLYGVFVSTVARGRDMSEDDVKKTEALCYDAEEAIDIGFADKIESLEDGLKDYVAELNLEDEQMTTQSQDTGKKFSDDEMAGAKTAAEAAGKEAGAKAERERIAAVLTCENAVGREAAAIEMALDTETSFSAKTANTILGRMPKAAASTDEGDEADEDEEAAAATGTKASKDHFSTRMNKEGGTEVGPGKKPGASGQGGGGDDQSAIAARVIGHYKGETGEQPAANK